ncbi:hypothetical protein ACFL1H_01435 [Nanoarchaeota archaeon]
MRWRYLSIVMLVLLILGSFIVPQVFAEGEDEKEGMANSELGAFNDLFIVARNIFSLDWIRDENCAKSSLFYLTEGGDLTDSEYNQLLKDLEDGKDPCGRTLVAFLRFLIAVLIFAVLYAGSKVLPFENRIKIVIVSVITVITMLFIPPSLLIMMGKTYATVMLFFFLGVPCLVGVFLLFVPLGGTGLSPQTQRIIYLIKALIGFFFAFLISKLSSFISAFYLGGG